MVTVVIVGILTAIAVPSYQKYAANAKMAEGHTIIGVIAQSEVKYFQEHNEFVYADYSSGRHLKNPPSLDPDATFQASSTWATLGYPMPLGSHSHFAYMVVSGKFDSSGTEVSSSSTTGNAFASLNTSGRAFAAAYLTPSVDCFASAGMASVGSTLGLSASADYNFSVIIGVGDLNGDRGSNCTGMVRIIEAMPSTNNLPSSRGTIILKAGN